MPQTRSARPAVAASFDPTRCRQMAGGRPVVLFSQHYAILCTRLAEEAGFIPGAAILLRTAETTFLPILREQMREAGAADREERAELCRSYWAACGMGDLRFVRCERDGGTAEMRRSHVDEGWLRLWGKRDQPVNLLTCGFLAAAWAAMENERAGTYRARETQSLVSGAGKSIFQVERR